MARDLPKPCEFPSRGGCQTRFLWTHNEVDLAPHPVVGLVLQVGAQMLRSFPRLSVSKVWILFSASKQGPCFTAIEEDGGDKSLVKLELNCKAVGVSSPDPL